MNLNWKNTATTVIQTGIERASKNLSITPQTNWIEQNLTVEQWEELYKEQKQAWAHNVAKQPDQTQQTIIETILTLGNKPVAGFSQELLEELAQAAQLNYTTPASPEQPTYTQTLTIYEIGIHTLALAWSITYSASTDNDNRFFQQNRT